MIILPVHDEELGNRLVILCKVDHRVSYSLLYRGEPRYIFTKAIYEKDSVQTSQFCSYQLC